MNDIREARINIVSEGTRLEGRIHFDQITRVHGTLAGEIVAAPGSTLILAETSVVEGDLQADTLMIQGYVKGEISASKRVVISPTGRVVGNIRTPSLQIDFGSYFEGRCNMGESPDEEPTDTRGLTSSRAPKSV